jgi:seryl-tRNA synthetase
MHDIRFIRENPKKFDASMAMRGLSGLSAQVLAIDEIRRSKILAAETALAERNAASKEVGKAKASGDEAEFERLRTLMTAKKDEIARLEEDSKAEDAKLHDLMLTLPNAPFEDTPLGCEEDDNVEIHRWGTPRTFDFDPVEHFDLPSVKPGMDFEMGAKLSGSRFVVLFASIARLHRALAQFMLDTHITKNGLTETWTPVLVREEMMYGTGQLPKFGEDSYKTTNGWWLIPTSEVTLTNLVNNTMSEQSDLPMRFTTHSQCFRSEAGSAGRDTSGMLRQHQFEKVEMVSITHPDHSRAELDRMTECAQGILEELLLPYRTVVLCAGDMGAGARRTHDIEVWLPGQGQYREISSCSVCGDYQARRMSARFKPDGGGKPEFVHTLNGSGLAVGRCLIAVLENGQQEDGSVELPAALHRYLGGNSTLLADGSLG